MKNRSDRMQDKIEIYARIFRYPGILMAISIFVASNLPAFKDNSPLMYIFFAFGIVWLVSAAYIDVRESERNSQRMLAGDGASTKGIGRLRRRTGGSIMVRLWVYRLVAVLVTFGSAITLYFVTSRPSWSIALVVLSPAATLFASAVERRSRDSEGLIRQLKPLVEDVKALEFTIRNCARDCLGNGQVQNELGISGVQGWRSYFDRMGIEQIAKLSLLESNLRKASPLDKEAIDDVLMLFYQILSCVMEAEGRYSSVCQNLKSLTQDMVNAWEYVRQTHQRIGTQLSGLKPLTSARGRGDLFDGFVNNMPQNLRTAQPPVQLPNPDAGGQVA